MPLMAFFTASGTNSLMSKKAKSKRSEFRCLFNELLKTVVKTLNTTAEMINHISKMRDQRRP